MSWKKPGGVIYMRLECPIAIAKQGTDSLIVPTVDDNQIGLAVAIKIAYR